MRHFNLRTIFVYLMVSMVTGNGYAQKTVNDQSLRQRADLLILQSFPAAKSESLKWDFLNQDKAVLYESAVKKIQLQVIDANKIKMLKGGGAVDTGGGTRYLDGLLDLALFNQAAFLDKTPGLLLPNTLALQRAKMDRLNGSDSAILRGALVQLKKWKDTSPVMVSVISEALQKLPIYYVNGKIGLPAEGFSLPPEFVLQGELKMMAYFVEDFGVFVSKSDLEQISFKNQIAVLLHESLRRLQKSTNLRGMDDMTLQKLTAKIMQDPTEHESLDTAEFLFGGVVGLRNKQNTTLLLLMAESEKSCQQAQQLCHVADLSYAEVFSSAGLRSLARQFSEAADVNHLDTEKEQALRSVSNQLYFTATEFALFQAAEDVTDLQKVIKYRNFDNALKDIHAVGFENSKYRRLIFEVQSILGI